MSQLTASKLDEGKSMQNLKKDIVNIKTINEEQQKRIAELEEKINKVNKIHQIRISQLEENANDAERKLNLWLYGLKEEEGEDVKERVIDLCRRVLPVAGERFPLHIDIVHRVGKKTEDKVRPVIIKFIARSTKELLLKTCKKSEYLRSSHLWFEEDLTQMEKEARSRLRPKMEAARKEGKKAGFVGAKLVIDGEIID